MAKRTPIRERIEVALNGRSMKYHDLALAVFPPEEFPRAWRYSSNGGPPGCYMALSSALRRHGFTVWWNEDRHRIVRAPRSR